MRQKGRDLSRYDSELFDISRKVGDHAGHYYFSLW